MALCCKQETIDYLFSENIICKITEYCRNNPVQLFAYGIIEYDSEIIYTNVLKNLAETCKWLIGTDDTDKHDDWLNWLPLFQDIVGIIEVNKFMLALSDYDMRVER